MDPRAEYLIQILEKIGAPLMGSITAVSDAHAQSSAEKDAQIMASLLAKTVQVSIDMANATDLAKAGIHDDSLRVALAGLAGSMVADQYRKDGKIPEDSVLKKITSSLQTVMTFSENFTSSPENTERLKDIAANGKVVDAHQVNIQYIHAFIPVVNAVGRFSFGQPEQKLVMDISSKLVAKAASLGRAVLGDLPEEEQKLVEVALLRSLSEIYAQCHEGTTNHIMSMNEDQRAAQPQAPGGGLSLDPVWEDFETRVAMLEAIAQNTLPAGKASEGRKAPSAPSQTPPEIIEQPKNIPPPPAVPPSAPLEVPEDVPAPTEVPIQRTPTEIPPAPPPATPPPAMPAKANPMSMFAKPKDGEEQKPATPTVTETPPPSIEEQSKTSENTNNSNGNSGSPMAFFKSPPKNNDDE